MRLVMTNPEKGAHAWIEQTQSGHYRVTHTGGRKGYYVDISKSVRGAKRQLSLFLGYKTEWKKDGWS
ncbi:hypothetical protein [Bacillus sp. FSL K6-6540]|uniref:hypothetical protein n=1 Tax=Bacillus sp. FSL K6-6540 TaxID=2921512 RepID=UPI0030F711C9